jgi:hypothetical protein
MSEPHGDEPTGEKPQDKPKLEAVAARATRKVIKVRPGGLSGALLGSTGVKPRVVTTALKEERAKESKEKEKERVAAETSLADEFFAEFASAEFAFGKHALDHFAKSGERRDEPTIDLFDEDDSGDATVAWLKRQPSDAFHLNAEESESHGKSIGFTVYFLEDRKPPRRYVFGYMSRPEKAKDRRYRIVHIGPAQ